MEHTAETATRIDESRINEIEVDGAHLVTARGRIAYVVAKINRRTKILDDRAEVEQLPCPAIRFEGRPLEVYLRDLPALLADAECRAGIERLCEQGARTGVVGLIIGDHHTVSEAATISKSAPVISALVDGRTLRMAPAAAAVPRALRRPETDDDAEFYSEALSVELWAALMIDDVAGLARVFQHVRSLGEIPGGPTERRLVADALRRAADVLLPGAGGMLGPSIPCPLCLASPMLRPDEVPTHLVQYHGNVAEGMRS